MYFTDIPACLNSTIFKSFVEEAFKEIKTKDGKPYFDHCISVANLSLNLAKDYPDIHLGKLAILAICHDVIEDLPKTVALELKDLLYSVYGSNELYDLLDNYLTYRPIPLQFTRKDYIDNIANSSNIYVKLVKLADLTHNSLLSRSKSRFTNPEKDLQSIAKYYNEYRQIYLTL